MNLLELQKKLNNKSLADIIYRAYEMGLEDNPFEAARQALALTNNKEERLELLDLMENWVLSDEQEGYVEQPETLKACEVMSMLGITRQTLTSYKKRNLIRAYIPLGKGQYVYYKEDVLKLLAEGGKKH